MKEFFFKSIILYFLVFFISCSENGFEENGTDNNVNAIQGAVLSEGRGIPNVVVSDGTTTTTTDENGNYNIEINPNADFIFISLPSGYNIPNKDGIAEFFKRVITVNQSVDFHLEESPIDDTQHAFIIWADPQIPAPTQARFLNTEVATDVLDHISQFTDVPFHGITVGDIVNDRLDLFPDYISAVNKTTIPFFQVVGNHDLDYKASSQRLAESPFKSYFGPTYYSFNRGNLHYVILNNIAINYRDGSVNPDNKYHGYVDERQLEWLKEDLKYIEPGSTVVVAFHIPFFRFSDEINRSKLREILRPYNVHIISGHTHYNRNIKEADNLFEHNTGAICGAWWNTMMCVDGTPAGYGVYFVDGDEINWYYKSTQYNVDYQLRVYPPGYSDQYPGRVIANAWNFDSQWTVEWYEDGVLQGEMTQFQGYDPEAYNRFFGPNLPVGNTNINPSRTDHLFYAEPSNGVKNIEVKVTDRFGNTFQRELNFD